MKNLILDLDGTLTIDEEEKDYINKRAKYKSDSKA